MITNNILLYSSRPEFIYYFDPHLDIQTKIGYDKYGIFPYIRIGFFDKGKVKVINNLTPHFNFLINY